MNQSLKSSERAATGPASEGSSISVLNDVFRRMTELSRTTPAPTRKQRRDRLARLRKVIVENENRFEQAISADFGHRSPTETSIAEILLVLGEIRHARANLRQWMAPQHIATQLQFWPARNRLMPQPLGVVGIIAPWNYPLQLTLAPAVGALAAGNRVLIKPSELAPRFAALLKETIAGKFDPAELAVTDIDGDIAQAFAALPFDHLIFTGSTRVGRRVAAAAGRNLTPVTLELGGKSPVIIDRSANLEEAAERVAYAKLLNAGQTCIAPDYALVPADLVESFAEAFLAETRSLYPTIAGNPDYSSIVSDRHYRRLVSLVDGARAAGARVLQREDSAAAAERKLPPTVLLQTTPDMPVMQEEIFGPILPVVPYTDLDQAIQLINGGPRPLALYCFSNDHAVVDGVLNRTVSGGVTVNGTLMHVAQDDLPFGGVGPSGTGAYHGHDGFLRFSHARAVFEISRFSSLDRLAPPYGRFFKFVTGLLLGK